MREKWLVMQLAAIFVGTIVGAGLSSGRELNQFFAVCGYKGLLGLFVCGLLYIVVGRMIISLSMKYKVKSYNEFIDLVCPKGIALFTNIVLTLFLLSSTSIIFAGSCAVVHQYFGIPKWIGFILMLGCSVLFLLRNTEGLFEVNSVIVPLLFVIMSSIFVGYAMQNTDQLTASYLRAIEGTKGNWVGSSLIYTGFNIISIIGVIVPLVYELKEPKLIYKGVILGTVLLTIMSLYITFLMMVNPEYPRSFEIPILAVAQSINKYLQIGLLCVIWLEMFSSQISNIFSLTRCLESTFKIGYKKGMVLIIIFATPFSFIGFSKLVEVLYPLYGVLSLAFLGCCITFYLREKISFIKK